MLYKSLYLLLKLYRVYSLTKLIIFSVKVYRNRKNAIFQNGLISNITSGKEEILFSKSFKV